MNRFLFGFLLSLFKRHFGLHEQQQIEIQIPMHIIANKKIKIYG
jgi:hypothetical protein